MFICRSLDLHIFKLLKSVVLTLRYKLINEFYKQKRNSTLILTLMLNLK